MVGGVDEGAHGDIPPGAAADHRVEQREGWVAHAMFCANCGSPRVARLRNGPVARPWATMSMRDRARTMRSTAKSSPVSPARPLC